MSFWERSPGPFWRDYLQSMNPFVDAQSISILDTQIQNREKSLQLQDGFQCLILEGKHADIISSLLKKEYVVFPRALCLLSPETIYEGFTKEKWLGLGILNSTNELVASVISKPLGDLLFHQNTRVEKAGLVDFLCVATPYRKMKLSSFMLQELVALTAAKQRIVHIFQKEGLPLSPLPPLWTSQYIWRKRNKFTLGVHHPGESLILCEMTILDSLRQRDLATVQNRPESLGSSTLWKYTDKGKSVLLCLTDLHHRSVPEGERLGEILWQMDLTDENTQELRQKATEILIDRSSFDIVLMDYTLPYHTHRNWQKDSSYSWYIFNCNPGTFLSMRPYWTF